MKTEPWVKKPFVFLVVVLMLANQVVKAQLNAADSTWFLQNFGSPRYCQDSILPGNWYMHSPLLSKNDFHHQIDSVFKFGLADFEDIDSMLLNDTLFYETARNTTFNTYPWVFKQKNPLTYINFTLNEKKGTAYNYFFPKDTGGVVHCDRAYVIVPGYGNNTGIDLVQGYGQYNALCFVANQVRSGGDVFAMVKPNEDARALHWNKKKYNHFQMVTYLASIHHAYGLNYLIELIATIKLLKQKYSKVVVLGAAEGGFASLMASLVTHPDAAVISAGYAIGMDTSFLSYSVLREKFDSVVITNDRTTIKNNILANNTQYLFAWGAGDPVNLMQAEYDSNYTEKFFNDTTKISSYYNFSGHTFPNCEAIDSFICKKVSSPSLSFNIIDTTNADTMITIVRNCSVARDHFDLFKNGNLYQSYNNIKGDTLIPLTESGVYYLKNIASIYGDASICIDTIHYSNFTIDSVFAEICFGDSIVVGNSVYFQSGVYMDTLAGDTVVVSNLVVHPLPNVVANATDSVLCAGDSTVLFGSGAYGYNWNNLVTDGMTFYPNATNTYLVSCTDAFGCENSDSIQIIVNPLPIVVAHASDTSICIGDQVTLYGSGADMFIWSNSVVDGLAFLPNISTNYFLSGFDTHGCNGKDSIFVSVNPLPQPILAISNDTLFCSNPTGLHISWYKDMQLLDSLVNFYVVGQNGNYHLVALDSNGCVGYDSIYVSVLAVSSQIKSHQLQVYPNPTSQILNISSYLAKNGNVDLILHDLLGNKINLPKQKITSTGIHIWTVDLSKYHLKTGIYLLEVNLDGQKNSVKFEYQQ